MSSYITVPADQTSFILSGNGSGAKGDYLERITIKSGFGIIGRVDINDGSTTINLTNASIGEGVYVIPLGIYSKEGPWSVNTQLGVSVIATGDFT